METNGVKAFLGARDFLLAHREDYDAAYRGFVPPRLQSFNWALEYFDVYARGNRRTALRIVSEDGAEEALTFADLSERSNRVANFLRGRGVRRGDRIMVMLGNVVPLWEVTLAAIKLGAVVSPATTLLMPADLADRIDRGGLRHVVADSASVEKFHGLEGLRTKTAVGEPQTGWLSYADAYASPAEFAPDGETRADDLLLLYFTSGTTAMPKMVMHGHQSYPVGHLSTMYWLGLREGDLHYNISSPGWAKHAWSSFFAPWNAGATIFVFNQPRFAARPILEAVVRAGVTSLCAPPTVWRMFILEDLGAYAVRLREVVGAGEPLNPEIIERVRSAWNLTVRDGYGQTETTALVGNSPGQPVQPGSMGRPLPGYRIVLLDAEGQAGDEGQLSVGLRPSPIGMMQGYLGSPAQSAAALGGDYYRTGDVVSRDADGYLWFVGRADDVFKSSDYRISPFELESALIEHAAVAEAAVVPSPDAIRLSVPKAYVTLKPGFEPTRETALEILSFTRERLAPYKRIRRVEFCELPKTISGKIRRVELRDREHMRPAGGRSGREYREEEFPELAR
jgi:acetyl-CoA synthetase